MSPFNEEGMRAAAREYHADRLRRSPVAAAQSILDIETMPKPHDTWPEPDMRLVDDDRAPEPKFDWDAVPPTWRAWLEGTAEECSAPPDYVVANLFGIASAVVGNSRRVSPWPGWVEQPHIWIANVGRPSSNKTPALAPFKRVCAVLEKDAQPGHCAEMRRWKSECEHARAVADEWKQSVKIALKEGTPSPEMPANAEEPPEPPLPRLMIADATTEEAVNILTHNPRGLALVRSELAGWLGQFDRYSGTGSDRAFYLECWDGGSHMVDRVKHKRVPMRVPYASLAIVGTMQPDRLRDIFSGPDDGLAARFIYIWPDPVPPRRPIGAGAEGRAAFLLDAFRRLRALDWDRDSNGEPAPKVLRLDAEALDVLDQIREEVATANRTDTGIIAGWRGKNPGRLLRLALVIEMLEMAARGGVEPEIITGETTRRAADFLDYATAMMMRAVGELAHTEAQRHAARIARLILAEKPSIFNERALYQREGFSDSRDKDRRTAAFGELQTAGWIRRANHARTGRPRGDWEANPCLFQGH